MHELDDTQGYQRALDALRYFCLPAESQLCVFNQHNGDMPQFLNDSFCPTVGDYSLGVSAVFSTYLCWIYDRYDSPDDMSALGDFKHLMDVLACNERSEVWSENGVRNSERWQKLRILASKALTELNEDAPKDLPRFDFASDINADEFRTSAEVRQLLE